LRHASLVPVADRVVPLAPNRRDHVQRARHSRPRFVELAERHSHAARTR
jgi:hypothetical protein